MEVFRVLPRPSHIERPYWTGGESGQLLIQRCASCGFWIHTPQPRCTACMSLEVAAEAVSGRGIVHTFTLNHQPWNPTYEHPYVIAVVELEEQAELRVTTNIVDCDPHDVHIDMPVEVTFLQEDDVWLPMFRPRQDQA